MWINGNSTTTSNRNSTTTFNQDLFKKSAPESGLKIALKIGSQKGPKLTKTPLKQRANEDRPENPSRGKSRESSPETLINRGLKNPKHGKHASQVGDGYLTVRGSEVLISLGFKIRQSNS
jgi:hypothetical protein